MSRRGGRGGGHVGQKLDLIPTVPELYPSCSPPKPLNDAVNKFIPKYHEMIQYMLSNYKIGNNNNSKKRDNTSSSFVVERFSDQYHAPLKLDARLTHSTDQRRLPQELGPSKKRTMAKKIKMEEMKAKKALERLAKLPDEEDMEMEEGDTSPSRKKIKLEPGEEPTEAGNEDEDDEDEDDDIINKKAQIENDEEEEEVDEELDEGTDYASNWFDNGENYGDSDEDNLDDTYS